MKKIRLGFVPSHRYPFDEDWAIGMRRRCLSAFKSIDSIETVVPSVGLIHNGLVRDDVGARATIDLFAKQGVQGIILGTMTYGDEISAASVAEALDLPVLVFGTREGPFAEDGSRRSDSFSGTLSLTSALHRRRIPHIFMGTIWPEDTAFARWVLAFARACAAVNGFLGARIGMFGLRPERVETSLINEVALVQRFRQRVVNIPLSEVFASANARPQGDHRVLATLNEIKREADCRACSEGALLKAARLELALRECFRERELSAAALSCWRDMQEVYGICACLTLSRLTQEGMMTSCEADVYRALTMLVQYLASLRTTVPCLIEWAIQHQELENVFLAWHCGNASASLAADPDAIVVREESIMSRIVGPERAQCAIEFQLKPGMVTLCSLAECEGEFKMLITRGEVIRSADELRGTWGWVKVPDLAGLHRTLAEQGFTNHASMVHGDIADAVEAFCKFVGIQVVRM
jgi:L-fucose isomerase-like protein